MIGLHCVQELSFYITHCANCGRRSSNLPTSHLTLAFTARIKATAARLPGVLGLDKCFVRKMGFSFYVDLHIIVCLLYTSRCV